MRGARTASVPRRRSAVKDGCTAPPPQPIQPQKTAVASTPPVFLGVLKGMHAIKNPDQCNGKHLKCSWVFFCSGNTSQRLVGSCCSFPQASWRVQLSPPQKRHQQEHRPQQPTESSDPAQHAKGRTGDCWGPRKETATRWNVTQGVPQPPPLGWVAGGGTEPPGWAPPTERGPRCTQSLRCARTVG